mmetsp:Transcript_35963/g.88503  ORF Transcript_35963/g.88503 Transcript_35963/m.88503 type:complete len:260 (-) Transcript_35963:44-823(-)|eukprot:CAMPEP_0206222256 /NCGR_PEP_ID=MMETSP0047_2-20121206/5862_1 /ASSEMBLY_ACC=CAM_ASM_000192 /TAXON_ID=195065 /ORGANISM="Chroomonas mesostigmatica_cf, Strain CCMP1168" /LENGTH=259 /DNA_ID=CAMNT_0053645067 /DNA_START=856 /DNA_END=1636 /DNA_ORIENTATION=+
MDVECDTVWELLYSVGELDDAVAVGARTPHVQVPKNVRPADAQREGGLMVIDGVGPVVGVDDAHNPVERLAPLDPLMVPGEVLGLLEDSHVALLDGDRQHDVARREDGAEAGQVHTVPPSDFDLCYKAQLGLYPVADVLLELLPLPENLPLGEDVVLLLGLDPRHAQRHAVLLLAPLQVHRAQQRVHRRARHPRECGRCDDGDAPAPAPEVAALGERHLDLGQGLVRPWAAEGDLHLDLRGDDGRQRPSHERDCQGEQP